MIVLLIKMVDMPTIFLLKDGSSRFVGMSLGRLPIIRMYLLVQEAEESFLGEKLAPTSQPIEVALVEHPLEQPKDNLGHCLVCY